jgi:uncharacterized protein with ParB-like and HNH nuclease domain
MENGRVALRSMDAEVGGDQWRLYVPEIKDIFSADPYSIWQTMCDPGLGFYIPAYQRGYAWEKSKVRRLFEDTGHNLRQLLTNEDATTFIGSIITIDDTTHTTIHPKVVADLPGKVKTVIDGQQRLTTVSLANVAFHEEISKLVKKFEGETDPENTWIYGEAKKLIGSLRKSYEEDMNYGDADYQWYPKLIRAFVDTWSRHETSAVYVSPIANFLHSYGVWAQNTKTSAFSYDVPELDGEQVPEHKFLNNRFKDIRKIIRTEIATGKSEEIELPSIDEIITSKVMQDQLFKSELPTEVIDTLKSGSGDEDYSRLFRIIIFTNFWLHKIAVTIVTAKSEDYAFDMFEALNTTGEQLTAYETFKPKVVQAEGLGDYQSSPSHDYLEIIDNYLNASQTSSERLGSTNELITSFILAEKGTKTPNKLSDQRRELSRLYDNLGKKGIDDQRSFTQLLSHVAQFLEEAWPANNETAPEFKKLSGADTSETRLCLDLLRQTKHRITIAPIVRFYSEALTAETSEKPNRIRDLKDAILAVTAFSVLWRMSRQSTDGIDTHYRNLMFKGIDDISIKPFARYVGNTTTPDIKVKDLKDALRHILKDKGEISGKNSWVNLARQIPAYKTQKSMARFLLLAAAHDTVVDSSNPGCVMPGTTGVLNTLGYDEWRDEDNFTVEHVAPQTPEASWEANIYADINTVDCLGNLTLLPQNENSSVGNRPWKEKKIMFEIFSAKTEADAQLKLKEASVEGIMFSATAKEIFAASKFHPHLEAISKVGIWDKSLIEKRSEKLAELAWDKISTWLDF